MRRVVIILALLLGNIGAARPASAQEAPLNQIQSAISAGVQRILASQRDDGRFVVGEDYMKDYPLGSTGLALLALEYARPHLKGALSGRTLDAIRKGFALITQNPPEQRTYSAGLVISALYKENPDRYKNLIGLYATMLVLSQHDKGEISGSWGYRLLPPPGVPSGDKTPVDADWGDRSNMQFALLGLYQADRLGFQVPKIIWTRSREHYLQAQLPNGGWGYQPEYRLRPYANMTIASTISLNLCEEMLLSQEHKQCIPPPRSVPIENGLKWIANNWDKEESGGEGEMTKIGSDTYGLYALERLGIIMGRANIGEHDWFNEGARTMLKNRGWSAFAGSPLVATCFGVMFLSRGLEPVIINKLERRDTNDWNNDPYDIKHLVEFINDHYQIPVQWRIVSLEAPLDLLQRTPILYISGHHKLDFNDDERKKLKAYVDGGGTILGQACCSSKTFDKSFRQVMTEIFGGELRPVPKTHPIYERMKTHGASPTVEMLALDHEQGRPAVIYLPNDQCCRWQVGGAGARESFAVGTGIYFYVTIEGRKMFENARLAATPAAPATPEPGVAPQTPTPNPEPAPAAPQPEPKGEEKPQVPPAAPGNPAP